MDNGYTPHLAVKVDSRTQVPPEYVKDGEITLNISPNAVHKLQMGNELIEFSARFGGVARADLGAGRQRLRALRARDRPRHDLRHRGAEAGVQAERAESEPASNTPVRRRCPRRCHTRAAEQALRRRQADTAPHQVSA